MQVVVDYKFLTGTQNETIFKEEFIATENDLGTFHFQSPNSMRPHGVKEDGLNWDDGHIPYRQRSTVLGEAVAVFAFL